jgi:hypothetical protein
MTRIAGFRHWSATAAGVIACAGFASPVFAATGGLGSGWTALLETDPATSLLYGSIGLLVLALALKFAVWAEERRNYRPQFFPTDRQIPIEPTPQ